MPALIETLSSYVPALIVRRLATDLSPISEPIAEHFPAAVLFTDITGFTALTERLAQRGPVGAEELSRVLNAYFGQLIDLVVAHGGDIVKFAGDALMTLWPATDTDLATVTRWATQCGFAVQQALHNYDAMEGVQLALRVGVAAGEILAMHIGGVFGRWEYVVAGAPLIDVAMAEHHAEPGQVIVSPGAWQLVQDHCVGRALPTGDVQLEAIHTPSPPRPLEKSLLSDNAETQLRAYIPGAIRARVAAGQTGWLAELRRITVLFINLPDLNYDTPLDHAQTVMRSLQESLYRYEGSINKLSVDDKGITLVAALGLPPLAHEDDASRGVQAAMAMQAKLGELGLHSATGIVSGQAFCGAIGSELRREYTMMGDVVNLSARLMQAAPNDILCDTTTYQAAQSDLMFDMLPPITVKGKAEPITI
ncbi:MAG: adenylate/guanylate cyclase domain-containing protein, partial [Nitrospinae bacterium]|nr:adenylate/guanylate cyclase domain-containing protein [Nitrospinota bacterium]